MFTGVRVEVNTQRIIDEIEKILWVMHATNVEGVEFIAYQLKDVSYQWYKEWELSRRDNVKSTLWDAFSSTYLDRFFSQELREVKVKEFVNLK